MTPGAAKEFFKARCTELGLDYDSLIKLSAGSPSDPKRFKCQCSYLRRTNSQLYIVKYFQKEDVYIAWNLKEPKARTKNNFSLQKIEIASLKPGQILPSKKGIEYREWDSENTFAFKPDTVTRFLKNYVVPRA